MEVGTVFVSGANRGIGLEMVKQLANLPKPPEFIFATYRDKNTVKGCQTRGPHAAHNEHFCGPVGIGTTKYNFSRYKKDSSREEMSSIRT
ncbi:hypothetical protein TNCV_173921 [Trichonephila clavipes]|nr:hypothetical protein TNCV_173921 [Trichonephila clavipes]